MGRRPDQPLGCRCLRAVMVAKWFGHYEIFVAGGVV